MNECQESAVRGLSADEPRYLAGEGDEQGNKAVFMSTLEAENTRQRREMGKFP